MAKKNIRTLGRKALSLLLTLTMVTGMLQIPAMAASSDHQIMDGYYIIDENGNRGLAPEGVSTVEEDGFTLSKTIAGTSRENEFEITLTVETSETVVTSDAAVQLVIDTSSSMRNNCGDCRIGVRHTSSHRNRLEALKDILTEENGFLDSLATANTGKVYVSVVYFNANAGVSIDWTDIKAEGGLAAVKAKVEALPEATGTNIHAGLMLARNRLGMDTVKNAGAKYTVLLSDGEAHHCSSESSSTTSINGGGHGDATDLAKNMADQLKKLSSVYAVGYGVQKSYLEGIVGKGDHVLAGDDAETVGEAFANIAQSATEGMSGAGAAVTDPMGQSIEMGQYIILDLEEIPADLAAQGVTKNGNGISWALDPANAEKTVVDENTTKYTYSITYPIKLDTTVPGFEENKYYPTNGHTFLTVPQENGQSKKINFLVPGVCGEIPSYGWSVEYYLQTEESINAEAPAYELDDTYEGADAKLWTSVDAPEGHENKYGRQGYYFAEGDTRLVISTDEEKNVIRLYYDLIVAPVTEKHYYKTTTITPAGETVEGEYVEDPDKTSTTFALVGSRYEAAEQLRFGNVRYEFEEAISNKSIIVNKDGENLVELYYSRVDDQCIRTNAQVNHVYIESVYELNEDGKYELVEKAPIVEEKAQYSERLPATSVYNVGEEPLAEYAGYVLNPELGDYASLLQEDGSLSFVLEKESADNIRTLYFEKEAVEPQETTVTVKHYYTKTVVSVENGEVVTTVEPAGKLGLEETVTLYKGERFEAEEVNEYLGDTYVSDAGNNAKLHIASVEGGEVIELYYELSVYPEEAEVVANHTWRTFTEVTVEKTQEVVNEETGETTVVVIGTTTKIRETEDHTERFVYTDLYEGQKHIEALQSWGEGYTFNEEESTREVIAGEGVEADLFYDKFDEVDEREDADIAVQHIYTTYWTGIVDGEVKEMTVTSEPVEEFHNGLAGDTFTAKPQNEYNGSVYNRITDDAELSVILQPGTNGTIVIRYERKVNALESTDYTVSYEYRTYTMSINESGVAGYWAAPAIVTEGTSGKGYVGQKVELNAGEKEGFAPLQTNPATEQILKTEGNEWTFVYEKRIPLETGSVVVNHHYKTVTVAVNGTSSESVQSVPGTPVTKYVGESYVAHAALLGFKQTAVTVDSVSVDVTKKVPVTVGAATVVDFYYEKTMDFSVPVTYSIAHEYYLYDWDGSLVTAAKPEPLVGTGFATNPLVVAPESSDYELTSATYNGVELENYTITLQEGENKVVFVYEKTQARDFVDATIIHNYYKDEAALNAEEPVAEKQFVENKRNLPEGSVLAAEQHNDSGYVFHSAAPESMEIVVTDEGENIIVLNYIRAAASYEVVHIYNRNGREEGRTSETFGGLAGDKISAESIARVNNYNGRSYRFVSISDDIVLDSEVVGVIEVIYNRTVFRPTPDPQPENPDPQPEPDPEIPVIEIPDEDVPLADEPVVEIPDEEVPLAEVPKTGDESFRFVLMALASALGLAALHITGRKREEENI